MTDWNIQSRAHGCQACRKQFADKQALHTILFDHKSGYERIDICESCWQTQYSQGATDKKGFISHWQSSYLGPQAAPPDPIQKDTAEDLLRKLILQNDPKHAGARYILAAMLERKRLLKVKAQVWQEGLRVFVYEHPKSGDLFNVADPNLRLDQLEEVQKDVARLLEHGLEEATPAPLEPGQGAPAPPQTETASTAAPDSVPPAAGENASDPGNPSEAEVRHP